MGDKIKEIDFEETMKELEQVVCELEKGDLNLDKSVEKFEEGIKLSKKCSNILEKAENKIKILIETADGVEEEDFKVDV